MPVFKKILLVILTPLLPVLLFTLAFDFGVVHTIGDSSNVKRVISESGLYDTLIPTVLKQTGQINTPLGDIPASNPLVQSAAQKAVPSSEVKKNVEGAIDNIYSWLNGDVAQPNFSINFSGSNGQFANSLADNVQQKLSTLPVCTTAFTVGSFDPVDATCLPPGVSAKSAADSLRSSLNSTNFLSDANFSASDFKGQDTNKTVFQDQLSNAPKQYQRVKATPIILAILAVIVACALVLLRSSLSAGLRHVGITVFIVGLLMIIFAVVFNAAITDKVVPNINIDNSALQTSVRNVVTDLTHNINKNYWDFGILYALVGLALFGGGLFISKRAPKPVVEEAAVAEDAAPDKDIE